MSQMSAPGRESGARGPGGAARRLPPVTELCVGSLALMLAGGVFIAANLPGAVPLGPPAGLLVGGGLLTALALGLLARTRQFSFRTFFEVGRWALLAYLVIASLLAYVFIRDGARGPMLVVLVATLFLFALDVPTVIAFTVAKLQEEPG
jgi:hypothetical protein